MAYLKDYKYDIFISYCHTDNLIEFDEPHGWIEYFYKNLETSLWKSIGKRNVTIWWDKTRLDGNTLFNESIADALKNSAILICLNSRSYLESLYCKKELDLFYKHAEEKFHSIKVEDRSRILNVLLYNIPRQKWPREFDGTTGFPFHDSVEIDDQGHPFKISSEQFRDKLQSLCDSLVKLIEGFGDGPPPPPPVFDIFFGDVSDNLRTIRKRAITEVEKQTINELKKHKIEIIPDIPPPYEKDEHETSVNGKLEKAEFSVHLLDQVPGRNIEGEETLSYPQKQAELSLLTSKPKLIWVPADLNIETIEEEKYRNFLHDLENGNFPATGYKYVRSTKSQVSQLVIDMAKDLYGRWSGLQDGKLSVLIDTHFNDQLYALELSKGLLENEIQPFINPQEGDPQKNASILEDRIRQVSKLVFFYGQISRDWVIERMKAAVQLVVSKKYPIKEFFVLMLPPHKDPNSITLDQSAVRINVINNSDALQLDPNALQQIFKSIKAVS